MGTGRMAKVRLRSRKAIASSAAAVLALLCVMWIAAPSAAAYAAIASPAETVVETPSGKVIVPDDGTEEPVYTEDGCQIIEDQPVPLSMWEDANGSPTKPMSGRAYDDILVGVGALVIGGIIAFGLLRVKGRDKNRW